MNLVTLEEFAKAGESVSIEYKSSTAQVKSACETLSAFLNAEGGKVFIGIADNGTIIGQEVTDKTKRLIGNEVAKISPAAKIDVEYLKLEGKKFVIILSGSHQPDKKPYMYDGRAYIRVETNTLLMPQEYYNSLLSTNSYNNASHWEDHVIEDVTIEDLDEQEIIKTIKEGVNNGRIPGDYTTDDVKEALKHLRLLKDDKITAAAVVLFAKYPQKWLSQCLLKLARFQGNSHLDDFVDSKQIFGNAFSLIHELMTFSSRYLPVASSFPENLTERKDVPLFPIKVLREVFANAICHRDYTFVGGSIEFGIYDDRLEIWNYGLFPQGISGDKIKELHKSIPRNPKIANVLYYRKIIESWGRGINMIIKECVKAGHPEPLFSQHAYGTKVILPSKVSLALQTKEDISFGGVTQRQRHILSYITQQHEVTSSELKENLENAPSERTLQIELSRLKEMGILELSGYGRGAKWMIKKKAQKGAERRRKAQKGAERRRKMGKGGEEEE